MIYEEIPLLLDQSADDNLTLTGVQLPEWGEFFGLYIPAIADGSVTLQVSRDNSTYVPIQERTDNASDDAVVATSEKDPCFVDITDLLRSVPRNYYLKIGCAAQAGDITFYLTVRGKGQL